MADLAEAERFLERYPDVASIDVVLVDAHGIGRGKIIRRHELIGLFRDGRGMPDTLFAQDVAGDDVAEALPLFDVVHPAFHLSISASVAFQTSL